MLHTTFAACVKWSRVGTTTLKFWGRISFTGVPRPCIAQAETESACTGFPTSGPMLRTSLLASRMPIRVATGVFVQNRFRECRAPGSRRAKSPSLAKASPRPGPCHTQVLQPVPTPPESPRPFAESRVRPRHLNALQCTLQKVGFIKMLFCLSSGDGSPTKFGRRLAWRASKPAIKRHRPCLHRPCRPRHPNSENAVFPCFWVGGAPRRTNFDICSRCARPTTLGGQLAEIIPPGCVKRFWI